MGRAGVAGRPRPLHAPPAVVQPGSTWYFQLFYRDPGVGTGLNYSDAVTVPFCN